MVFSYGQIIENILEISVRIRDKGLGYSFGLMGRCIMVIGLIANNMERALLSIAIIRKS